MDVRLTTLGTPRVMVDGEERKELPTQPVVFGALVFLALEREVTRDRLLGYLWPESPPEKARQALSQTLHELRGLLGEEWLETRGNQLRTTPALWVDALEFEAVADCGRHSEAVGLYGGPLLDGRHLVRTNAFEEWLEGKRGGLARRYRAAVDAFTTEARAQGDLPSALESTWQSTGKDLAATLDHELADSLRIIRPIGRENLAEIFLARRPHLKSLVVVKVLLPDLASNPTARKRFLREAQAADRLNHPNVCPVYWVGSLPEETTYAGTPYYVSPFVKGTSLAHRLKAEGRFSPTVVRQVLKEVASALAAAHRLGIIHRDVRPDNVHFEEETGKYYLCDFGIAGVLETFEDPDERLTRSGEILGNPAYMSPEQLEGPPLTDRTDIYSLGVMAHELLTGILPPPGKPPSRKNDGSSPPPDLEPLWEFLGASDPGLVDLIEHCLATDPADRPSAESVCEKCGEGVTEPVPGFWDWFSSLPPVRPLMDRRLPQIMGVYAAGAWATVEVVHYLVEDRAMLPRDVESLVLVTILSGLIGVSILGWFHGKKGRQRMPTVERWLLRAVAVGWVVGVAMVLW